MDIDYLSLINDLKDDVDSIYKTINSDSFLNMVDFVIGDLIDGQLDESKKYRTTSKFIVFCPYDLHIIIKDGFKIYINIYEDDEFISSTEYTKYADIPAQTKFKIVICKSPDIKTEAADIKEFTSAVTYNNAQLTFKGEIKNTDNLYQRKIANINVSGVYTLNKYIEYWDDLPEYITNSSLIADQTAMLTIQGLKNNYMLQTLITASGYRVYRIIRTIDNKVDLSNIRCQDSNGWYVESNYRDLSNNAQLFDNKLYTIVNDGTYYIHTDTDWEDAPKGVSRYALLEVKKYSPDFSFQKIYAFSKESQTRVFNRIVYYDKSGIWNDWSEVSNPIKKVPSYMNTTIINEVSIYDSKKVSILGDSISTFVGYIPPGNKIWYYGDGTNDVLTVNDTWWMKVINALNMELCVNNSWSGRTVSDFWESRADFKGSGGFNTSQIKALSKGADDIPDVIIIKLGINDFDVGVNLGTYDGSTKLPDENSTNTSKFRESYAIMLNKIMKMYPKAEVWCCTLPYCEVTQPSGFPEINPNGVGLPKFNEAIVQLAKAFGAKIIDHASSGLTYFNLKYYMADYNSSLESGLHPNAKGHSVMANQTIRDLDPAIRFRYPV